MFGRRKKKSGDQGLLKDLRMPYEGDDFLPSALEPYSGNWRLYRPNTHVALKVWIPEPLNDTIIQLADHTHSGRSTLIREALFIYIYGRYAFAQMRAEKDGYFYDDGVLFSRTASRTPQLGKNSVNYKLWLPEALKQDMKTLADTARCPLSQFVREILISHFLGHLTLPLRQELLQQASSPPESAEEE